MADPVNRTTL